MKRYETYKNSGVKWIGEIPEGWECVPIKRLASIQTGTTPSTSVDEYWSDQVFDWFTPGDFSEGKFILNNSKRKISLYAKEKNACKIFPEGTVYLVGIGATLGKIGYSEIEASANQQINAIIFNSNCFSKFGAYYLQAIRDYICSRANSSTLPILNQTETGELPFLLPPLSEQQQIASYLDYKVGQIDSSVAKIVEQIEDLKSYRQSVISEAVTKGLNPNAKMKDSGVEWIGEIPEGWECVPMKRLASIQTGTTPSTSVYEYWSNPAFDWFTPGDFSEDKFILNNSKRKISLYAKEKNACRIFPGGTVYLVGIGATLGKIGYSEIEASANQQINAIIFNNNCFSKFGAYYLQAIRDYIYSRANSSTLPILNQTETGELPFLLPSLSEQQQIASYLDSKTSKIDSSIEALELQKSQLEDYKRSLISEAVTGKVDLRGWKTNKC